MEIDRDSDADRELNGDEGVTQAQATSVKEEEGRKEGLRLGTWIKWNNPEDELREEENVKEWSFSFLWNFKNTQDRDNRETETHR